MKKLIFLIFFCTGFTSNAQLLSVSLTHHLCGYDNGRFWCFGNASLYTERDSEGRSVSPTTCKQSQGPIFTVFKSALISRCHSLREGCNAKNITVLFTRKSYGSCEVHGFIEAGKKRKYQWQPVVTRLTPRGGSKAGTHANRCLGSKNKNELLETARDNALSHCLRNKRNCQGVESFTAITKIRTRSCEAHSFYF